MNPILIYIYQRGIYLVHAASHRAATPIETSALLELSTSAAALHGTRRRRSSCLSIVLICVRGAQIESNEMWLLRSHETQRMENIRTVPFQLDDYVEFALRLKVDL